MNLELLQQPAVLTKYSWLILIAAVLALLFLIGVLYARAWGKPTYQQAPNSRIAVQIESSFKPSDRFSGFIDDRSSASVVIIEFPAENYDQIKTLGQNPEALAAQGVTKVKTAELPGRSGDYVYLTGTQKTPLVDYEKFILIFRERNVAAMITANVPDAALAARAITRGDIEAILASAKVLDRDGETIKLFELSYLGPFVEDLSLMGSTKGYRLAKDPSPERGTGDLSPFFLVAPSLHKVPVSDLEASARKAFQSIDKFHNYVVSAEAPIAVSGMRGMEIIGEASEAQSGQMAGLYQVFLAPEGGGYFRLVGMAPSSEFADYLPEFRRMTQSFRSLQ